MLTIINQPALSLEGGLSKKWNCKDPEESCVHMKQLGSYVAFLINQRRSTAPASCTCKSAPVSHHDNRMLPCQKLHTRN